jgi:hypothetical protein
MPKRAPATMRSVQEGNQGSKFGGRGSKLEGGGTNGAYADGPSGASCAYPKNAPSASRSRHAVIGRPGPPNSANRFPK